MGVLGPGQVHFPQEPPPANTWEHWLPCTRKSERTAEPRKGCVQVRKRSHAQTRGLCCVPLSLQLPQAGSRTERSSGKQNLVLPNTV